MKRRLLSVIMAVIMAITVWAPMASVSASAANASAINKFQVQDRVTKLAANYNGTYFTVDSNYNYGYVHPYIWEPGHPEYNDCDRCLVNNIVKSKKIKNEYPSGVTLSYLPMHYRPNGSVSGSGSWTCAAFAAYGGYYIYGNGKNVNCSVNKIGTYTYSKGNVNTFKKKAAVGDIIGFYKYPNRMHSGIYIGTTSSGMKILHCNWHTGNDRNGKVYLNTVPWDNYDKVTINRGTNVSTATPNMTTVRGSVKDNAAHISWSAVPGADGYKIYRATSKSGSYKYYSTVADTDWDGPVVSSDVTYYYKVRAYNKFRDGTYYSNYSTIIPLTYKKVPVITASNDATTGKVKLSWTTFNSIKSYSIYRKRKSTDWEKVYSTTNYKTKAWTDKSATPGTFYTYKYEVELKNGDIKESKPVDRTCDLAKPTGLKSSPDAATGKPNLTWNAVENATNYDVYRAIKGGNYSKIARVSTNSYKDRNALTPAKTYYYKVIAIKSSNSGADSAISAYTYITCDLARPTITSITLNSNNKPVIKWNAVSGATKYELWRATSEKGTYSKVTTTTKTTYANTSATAGKQYYYKVRALTSKSSYATSAYSIPDAVFNAMNINSTAPVTVEATDESIE